MEENRANEITQIRKNRRMCPFDLEGIRRAATAQTPKARKGCPPNLGRKGETAPIPKAARG